METQRPCALSSAPMKPAKKFGIASKPNNQKKKKKVTAKQSDLKNVHQGSSTTSILSDSAKAPDGAFEDESSAIASLEKFSASPRRNVVDDLTSMLAVKLSEKKHLDQISGNVHEIKGAVQLITDASLRSVILQMLAQIDPVVGNLQCAKDREMNITQVVTVLLRDRDNLGFTDDSLKTIIGNLLDADTGSLTVNDLKDTVLSTYISHAPRTKHFPSLLHTKKADTSATVHPEPSPSVTEIRVNEMLDKKKQRAKALQTTLKDMEDCFSSGNRVSKKIQDTMEPWVKTIKDELLSLRLEIQQLRNFDYDMVEIKLKSTLADSEAHHRAFIDAVVSEARINQPQTRLQVDTDTTESETASEPSEPDTKCVDVLNKCPPTKTPAEIPQKAYPAPKKSIPPKARIDQQQMGLPEAEGTRTTKSETASKPPKPDSKCVDGIQKSRPSPKSTDAPQKPPSAAQNSGPPRVKRNRIANVPNGFISALVAATRGPLTKTANMQDSVGEKRKREDDRDDGGAPPSKRPSVR